MLQKAKLDIIQEEMKRTKINILGKSEIRWQGAEKIKPVTFEIRVFIQEVQKRSAYCEGPRHSKHFGRYQIVFYF